MPIPYASAFAHAEATARTSGAFVVGFNAPGYLPDAEPVTCASFEEAFFTLCADLVATREALYPDDDANADSVLDDATCAASAESVKREPFSVQAFGLAHWIEPAEAPRIEGKPGAKVGLRL